MQIADRLAEALAERYRIERELGAGGMATVYLAHDLKHGRMVAIKVLHPEISALLGPERFLKEIELTASLQHPHILPLFDSGNADGHLFYVMPYVEGETLRTRLERERQLPIDDAVRISIDVADALEYAHKRGVIHRDIKPENILLHDGRPIVADFGIALAVQKADGARMTQTGMSLGTPQYMAPEQAMGNKIVDARVDVYALGVVTYEMLSGEAPFAGPNAQAIIARVMTEDPRPLIPQRHTIPPTVERAVLIALEKLPADRFASAHQFSQALENQTIGSARSRAAPPLLRRSPGRLLAFLLLGVSVLAVWGWLRPESRREAAPTPLRAYLLPPPGLDFGGGARFAALSPDGTQLAFVGFSERGSSLLWVMNLSDGRVRELQGTAGANWPFWSPDAGALAFFARGELARVSSQGGGITYLCPILNPQGGAWSQSGQILFSSGGTLSEVSAAGSECRTIPLGDSIYRLSRPSALPDQHRFVIGGAVGPASLIFVVDDRTGAIRQIGEGGDPQFVSPGYLLFQNFVTNRASLVAQRFDPASEKLLGSPVLVADSVWEPVGHASYTASATGLLLLRRGYPDAYDLLVDRKGEVIDTIHGPNTWTQRLAHEHPWLVLGGFGLWFVDLPRRAISALGSETVGWSPAWSPGDSVIAYNAGCPLHLRRVADGRDWRLPYKSGRCAQLADWTPDGRNLLVTLGPGDSVTNFQIWRYSLGDSSLTPVVAGEANTLQASLSPDGHWLAYSSDETDAFEVYVQSYPGAGRSVKVSDRGGVLPRWRGDGRELFFYAPDGTIMSASVTISAVFSSDTPTPVMAAPFAIADLMLAQPYDVTPDGQRFVLHPSSARPKEPLVLMVNWPELVGLERR